MPESRVKWVVEQNYHITLYFLGEIPNEEISILRRDLPLYLQKMASFTIQFNCFGIFGKINSPKAIWLGLDASDELQQVKRSVDTCMKKMGKPTDDKNFTPHLSLGRPTFIAEIEKIRELLQQYSSFDFGSLTVNQVIIYESVLKPQGPVYIPLEQIVLKN